MPSKIVNTAEKKQGFVLRSWSSAEGNLLVIALFVSATADVGTCIWTDEKSCLRIGDGITSEGDMQIWNGTIEITGE